MTGEQLQSARKRLGLTQPALARLLGCSVWSIRDWEQGRRRLKGISLRYVKLILAETEPPVKSKN